MIESFQSALPSIIATTCIGVMGWVAGWVRGQRDKAKRLADEHTDLMGLPSAIGEMERRLNARFDELDGRIDKLETEMADERSLTVAKLKNKIVAIEKTATERGYITPKELESANDLADHYFARGGNHYIHAVMRNLNERVPIKGEPIEND
ncbi:hypothetical protein [Parvibacter caecicola]|uniref:Uncharacterized protein n=1 Tax=Parvibacter caecicola TaxID=747645 RepID=A0A7W5GR14_9ACTN|nr:hypothetical protein [Parvibacter caecicola]MBB3171813.1 hypothetical protein [Parvibacter caecicola]MCR2040628.1 hypothetical protein [Parvibacter caecicola]RNL10809.1 hypothetical protein DMP11_06065 [Parvibacter caecicola]